MTDRTRRAEVRLAIVTDLMAPYRLPLFGEISKRLGDRFRVFFMAPFAANRLWNSEAENAEFPHEFVPGHDLSAKGSVGYNRFWNPGMFRALWKFDPDVVVVGGYHHPTSFLALAFARLRKRTLVLWSESTALDIRPASAVRAALKIIFVRRCDLFLVPGTASKDYLMSFGVAEDRIRTSVNSTDVSGFALRSAPHARPDARMRFREEHGLPRFLILFVGRLVAEKGFPLLIGVVEELQRSGRDVGLLVAGAGDDAAEFQSASSCLEPGSVLFTGFVQQEELPALYANSDVLVLPSLSEPWGIVVNEAMSCGLPVVSSRHVGASFDMITDGETGFVCSTQEDYTRAVLSLVDDPGKRVAMASAAARRAQDFSPAAAADGFIELLPVRD